MPFGFTRLSKLFVVALTGLTVGHGIFVEMSRSAIGQEVTATKVDRNAKVVVSDRIVQLLKTTYIFDGHNDLPWAMRDKGVSVSAIDLTKNQPEFNTDIPRLRAGGVGAQFWSVFVPASTRHDGTSLRTTLEQIQLVKDLCARYPDDLELALTSEDVLRIRAKGKIASLAGMEGGHSIENSIEKLRQLYAQGARYMTLTHGDTLDWADAATDSVKNHGLSEFGEEVVKEMNRLGMLVDISHVSPETMDDVLRISQAPVIFSHSSARSVADHPRNVPDEILQKLPENGGVVMVNFFSGFVVPESAKTMRDMFDVNRKLREQFGSDPEKLKAEEAKWRAAHPIDAGTVHDVADHVMHIVKVAGINHVGIGSDYDGVSKLPAQMDDVSTYPVLLQVLADRGLSDEDLAKLASGNVLRVLQQAERSAERIRHQTN